MNELILFVSTFTLVFALGLQSLNVNGGYYRAAFVNSLLIGGAQMILLKLGPDASPTEIAAYLAGGPFGIVTSMWAHARIKAWFARAGQGRRGPPQARPPADTRGKVIAPRPWPKPVPPREPKP